MAEVDRNDLRVLVAKARAFDSPHIDLAKLLGLNASVKVGTRDLHALLTDHALPSFDISVNNDTETLTVSRTQGGVLVTLDVVL